MSGKTVQTLLAVIVALVLLLLVLDRGGDDLPADRTELLPGFKAVANDAREIGVSGSAGGEAVTIRRDDGIWVVNERDGYPADVGKLGQLISALAEAGIVEEKTANPANYAKLGVQDPAEGGSGTRVTVEGEDFSYSVILGETAQREFRYARVADEATSYLIDRNPSLPEAAKDWLVPEILDIPSRRVQRVTLTHADGETITIEKSAEEQTDFVVLDIPEGRALSYATVANGTAGALAGLEFDDVRVRVHTEVSGSAQFETWDGLEILIGIVNEDDATWMSFIAAPLDDESEAAEEAASLNARLSGWEYRIPSFKQDLLVRRWEDILKSGEAD